MHQFHGQSVSPSVPFIRLYFLVFQCPCDVSPQRGDRYALGLKTYGSPLPDMDSHYERPWCQRFGGEVEKRKRKDRKSRAIYKRGK